MTEPPTSFCPNCLAEYRPGSDMCADRGVKLVRGPAPAAEEHAPAGRKPHAHPIEGRIRVWVLESQLDEARAIAERALSGDDAV